MNVVKAAAELIKIDIKSCKSAREMYPSPDDIDVQIRKLQKLAKQRGRQ